MCEQGLGRAGLETLGSIVPNSPSAGRIDIGTSLANVLTGVMRVSPDNSAANREAFLSQSAATHELFGGDLFDGFDDPIAEFYKALTALGAPAGRNVKVAEEPDGRQYGPGIFRVHYTDYEYKPHINHVKRQSEDPKGNPELKTLQASRFSHNLAGLICFQNAKATYSGRSPTAKIFRGGPPDPSCLEYDALHPLGADEIVYHEYAEREGITSHQIEVQPGDFYLFNSGLMHEVPPVQGDDPRIVLATFIGLSPDDETDKDVFVWA